MSAHRHPRSEAMTMLIVANLFWGVSFPLTKAVVALQDRLAPGANGTFMTASALAPRFLIALALLLLIGRFGRDREPPASRTEFRQGLIMGAFIGVGMLFQIDGLRFTSASTSAFLTQSYAVLIPVILAVRHRKNPGTLIWICCALVLAGVAILGHFDWSTFRLGRGEVETLVSSLLFMGPVFCLADKSYAGCRSIKVTLVMFTTLSLIFSAVLVASAPRAGALAAPWRSPSWIAMTAALAVFPTLGAFWIMSHWQRHISATEAGLLYCLEPVFASTLALFLPGLLSAAAGLAYANEKVTASLLLGGALVTAANALIQLRPAAAPAAASLPSIPQSPPAIVFREPPAPK